MNKHCKFLSKSESKKFLKYIQINSFLVALGLYTHTYTHHCKYIYISTISALLASTISLLNLLHYSARLIKFYFVPI